MIKNNMMKTGFLSLNDIHKNIHSLSMLESIFKSKLRLIILGNIYKINF